MARAIDFVLKNEGGRKKEGERKREQNESIARKRQRREKKMSEHDEISRIIACIIQNTYQLPITSCI